jgi:hypothetical protein
VPALGGPCRKPRRSPAGYGPPGGRTVRQSTGSTGLCTMVVRNTTYKFTDGGAGEVTARGAAVRRYFAMPGLVPLIIVRTRVVPRPSTEEQSQRKPVLAWNAAANPPPGVGQARLVFRFVALFDRQRDGLTGPLVITTSHDDRESQFAKGHRAGVRVMRLQATERFPDDGVRGHELVGQHSEIPRRNASA